MDIHRGRKNHEELERVHERNFENPQLMRQILLAIYGKIFLYIHQIQIFDVSNFIVTIKAFVYTIFVLPSNF